MKLWVVRHGETAWNVEGRLQGQRDSGLTPRGVAQANAAARLLAEQLAGAAAELFTSPLGRARQTAEIVGRHLGLACREASALMEVSFGRLEGLTPQECDERFPGVTEARRADRWTFRPPDGENLEDATRRVAPWLAALTTDRPTIVVTHGVLSRVLRACLLGLDPTATVALPGHRNDELFELRDGAFRLHAVEVRPVVDGAPGPAEPR